MGGTSLTTSSKKLYSSLLSLLFLLLQSASGRELKFVLLIYRHGDRSPVGTFPTDLHNESEWPQGFGQLTKIGIKQQYELGQYIKMRYSNFLSSTYKRKEVLILSTDIDRTIMSAQANLAGLFPPSGDEIWNPELLWQPVPVHTVSKEQHPKLRFPMSHCPRYVELVKETMTSSAFQLKMQPYQKFIQTISLYSGYDPETLAYLANSKLWNVHDALLVESIHNFTLPKWATKDVMAKLDELAVITLSVVFGIHKREEKARLQGGLLVKDILEEISNAAVYPSKRKMLVYSAHDSTLGALHMALNIYNEQLFPYAACQFFELYQESNGEYTIEMYFRNDTTREPYLLTLPGCSSTCPLPQFAELVSPILVKDWASECQKTEGKNDSDLDINTEVERPTVSMKKTLDSSTSSEPYISKPKITGTRKPVIA